MASSCTTRGPRRRSFNRGNGYYLQGAGGTDLGEGPWRTISGAVEFLMAEVGVTARVVRMTNNRMCAVTMLWDYTMPGRPKRA